MNIYPSLISANLLELGYVIEQCSSCSDGFHIDIMDNHFVPNLTWGAPFITAFLKATPLPLHVHCMVDDPLAWARSLQLRSQDYFIFHYEAVSNTSEIVELCNTVTSKGYKVGIALNPTTEIGVLKQYVHSFDHVLLMSVVPGFSGQQCIETVFEKIDTLVHMREEARAKFSIALDGGIKKDHLLLLKNKKVDGVAMASAIFSTSSPFQTLQELYSLVKQ